MGGDKNTISGDKNAIIADSPHATIEVKCTDCPLARVIERLTEVIAEQAATINSLTTTKQTKGARK